VVVVSGKTIRQDFDYNNHVLKGKVLGLASPAEWQVAVLRIPEGVNPEAPPDPSIDWPSYAVDATPIRSDGSYSVEGLADGVYKAEVFQFQSDTIVPKGVWKTIAIAGEDLVLDLQARE
jgi:hypothetical protein